MNNVVEKIIIFSAGAAVGSLAVWKIAQDKYKKIADEEIKEVKEYYRKTYAQEQTNTPAVEEDNDEDEGPTIEEYKEFLKNETNYSGGIDISKKGEPVMTNQPYVISPEDYSNSDYDTVSLMLYADGVLTDELDDIVEDVEKTVGYDSLNHFGEYEEDSVFVRNDMLEIDYEILRDLRNYSDVHRQTEE